jgi:single-stranded-DNA-specific exonuclease
MVKRGNHNTIKEVVLANVGMSEEDFMIPKSHYHIDKLEEASRMIRNTGEFKQPITIVGDYDVDGIAASSILSLVFKKCGWDFKVRLPKRFSEGYGISDTIIDEIESGLVITVDNGIAANEVIEKAKDKGLLVIVTDHHLPSATNILPDADIVIDPKAIKGSADFDGYCGAGIAYKLAQKILGEKDSLMPQLQSLAAIATVADIMPLTGENRFIVKNGLKSLVEKEGRTLGTGAIINECKFANYISPKHIAFKIGPMLNAPGRLEDDGAMITYNLLVSNDSPIEAMKQASYLSKINDIRKSAKTASIESLEQNIIHNGLSSEKPLIIYEHGLLEGLLGILAGDFAMKYKVPCFVFTDSEDPSILKGSGRSYGGINIKELLDKHAPLIYKYGGHAEAAGISIKKENFKDFKNAMLSELVNTQIITDDTIYYDLVIDAKDIPNTLKELEKFAPFGEGNPEIVFYIKNFSILKTTYIQGGTSVKFEGGPANAICFDMAQEYKKIGEPKVVDLIGTLTFNSFRCVTNQVEVQKIIPVTACKRTNMSEMLAKIANERR